ncbi:MAG TPA: enoyl-CoA hydratase-related protein [Candidatus Krumholzibacteria bacterium]|nr:enoyl-CoA hydratase-related protein [Candidatus Krumholzibacteria bacterium]
MVTLDLEHILYQVANGIATITVNRAPMLNALSAQTVRELDHALAAAEGDEQVRVLIVTGAGEKAFVSGADISELAGLDPSSGTRTAEFGQRVFRRLETMGKPSIAAINGYALGGGCELAMACTIRVASDSAKIGLPEVTLGVIPGYAGTQRLPRIVGRGAAMDLILTGRAVDANEALRLGLVSQVVPPAELGDAARKTALRIQRNGPLAVRAAMQAVDHGLDVGFEHGCRMEATLFGLLCATDDMREGLKAFLDKRKAEFKGR